MRVYHISLIGAIISFVLTAIFYFMALFSLEMDELIDFFAVIAEISIYSQYMSIAFYVGLGLTILTILLFVFRV